MRKTRRWGLRTNSFADSALTFRVERAPALEARVDLRSSALRLASSRAALAAASMVALASARVLAVCWWVWT
ncbi:MAG: hypothetical protein ABSH01_12575 [Terriglobia bacterium]